MTYAKFFISRLTIFTKFQLHIFFLKFLLLSPPLPYLLLHFLFSFLFFSSFFFLYFHQDANAKARKELEDKNKNIVNDYHDLAILLSAKDEELKIIETDYDLKKVKIHDVDT